MDKINGAPSSPPRVPANRPQLTGAEPPSCSLVCVINLLGQTFRSTQPLCLHHHKSRISGVHTNESLPGFPFPGKAENGLRGAGGSSRTQGRLVGSSPGPPGERRQLLGAVTFEMTAFGGLGVSAGADTPTLPAVYRPGRVSSLGKRFLKKFGSSYIREGHGTGWKRWYFSNKIYFREGKKYNFVGTLKKKGRKPSPHV